MTDLSKTIEARSNQLNADDLQAAPRTIKITKVSAGNSDQPIAINYEGDNNKPFYPCKSMRRVLVAVWGADGASYVGRSMTLYRDPEVKFGGIAVGGIRISHMSHLDKPLIMALTATRGSKKPYTVKPLAVVATPVAVDYEPVKAALAAAATEGEEKFKQEWLALDNATRSALNEYKEQLKKEINNVEY